MAPHSDPLALATTLESTVGAYFLGAIATVGLSGITTLQLWLYFQKYPQDPVAYKLLVAFTWTLEVLRSCITIHAGYYYSVQNWGNILALLEPIWSMKVMVLLTCVVELGVHCFFVHKVWKATHTKVLCSIIMIFVIGDFALGLATYITATLETDFIEIFRGTPEHIAIGGLSCAIGADWLITFALVQFFRKNKTQFHRTNHALEGLIFYAVNMGLLISVTDAIVLILSVVPWPTLNFYQLTVYQVVGNLYANSLLACLNARDGFSQSSLHNLPRYGHVQIQISQQTWTSSETPRPTLELKPQAAMFTHAVQEHLADPIQREAQRP